MIKKDFLKVLVISHMYPSTFNEVEGIFVHQQVKELQRQGCEVKVISPVPWTPFPIKYLKKKWKTYSKVPERTNWDDVEVHYPRYLDFPKALFFASSGNRMYYGIKKIVDKIYQKFPFDIIHAHVALPDGWAGMRIAVKYKKSLIVTIHGQDFYKTIFRNKRCKESIEKVINFSNKTIVVSNKLRKIGRQNLDISSGKMRVIFNGIDLEELLTIKNHEPLLKCKNKKVILTVGYLIKRKAHRYVIKALTRLALKHPDIIYLIAGDGPEEKNLKKLVKEEKLEKFVKFLGRINHQEVMTLMRSCDIFVLPSWDEAFGVVYIEAMASGKPVIACKGQGITDVIKDGETGLLVKPKDVDSLVKAIDFLLSHPEEAKKMGERAKKLVLENYTWEKNAEKTIKVYKEVVGGR